MSASAIIFFIFFSAIATSYAWGMRGTIIGGEKGAMLPGAMLGLIIAIFSGSELLMTQPYLLAGIGAVAMYCGGNMTYMDTLDLSMKTRPAPHLAKGLIALVVKGGIWFGLFGGYVSMYISAISGCYSVLAMVLFFVCLPISALIGFAVFNTPFDPEKNKFPKIYFSVSRRETWGGLLGMLIEIFIFAAITKDYSTLAMTSGAVLSGAVGWVIAQILQINALHPGKNGKKLFATASVNNFIDAWKVMECALGAIAGGGIAVTFILCKPLFTEKLASLDENGISALIPEHIAGILVIVYGVILFSDTLQYFIKPKTNKRYYKKLRAMKLLTKEGYREAVENDKGTPSDHYLRYKKLCEHAEFAVYSIIPMTLCFFGVQNITVTLYFCAILLVLCQEIAEKCSAKEKLSTIAKIILFLPAAAVFITQSITAKPISIYLTVVMYTFIYEAAFFCLKILENNRIQLSSSEKTVHGYFIICCLVINILTLMI